MSGEKPLEYNKGIDSATVSEKSGAVVMDHFEVHKATTDEMEVSFGQVKVAPDGTITAEKGGVFGATPDNSGMFSRVVEGKNKALAEEIRKAYQGFKKDGVLSADEVPRIDELLDKAMQQLPLKKENPAIYPA